MRLCPGVDVIPWGDDVGDHADDQDRPKIVYLLTGRPPGLAVLVFRGDGAKDAELPVLRHENALPRRHSGRVRYDPPTGYVSQRWHGSCPAGAGLKSSPSAQRRS